MSEYSTYIEMWASKSIPQWLLVQTYTLQRLADGTLYVEPFVTSQTHGPKGKIIFVGTKNAVLQIKKENE